MGCKVVKIKNEYFWECEICKKKLREKEWKWSHKFSIVLCELCLNNELPKLEQRFESFLKHHITGLCEIALESPKIEFIVWLRGWIKTLFNQQFSNIRRFFDNIEGNINGWLVQGLDRQIVRELLSDPLLK